MFYVKAEIAEGVPIQAEVTAAPSAARKPR